MKQLKLILFYFLNSFFLYPQGGILVEYNYASDFYQNKETLLSRNNVYLYFNEALNLNNENDNNEIDNNEIDNNKFEVKSGKINIKKQTIYSTISSNILYLELPYNDKRYQIKDTLPNFEWVIHDNDEKKIGNFKCKKATTFFRGRHYIAYFTTDIPIGLGPWKFKGLPGLILYLESISGKNKHIWQSAKIIYPFNDYKEDLKQNFENYISLKDYNDIKNKDQNKEREISNSRLPNGVRMTGYIVERLGIELKYEWED